MTSRGVTAEITEIMPATTFSDLQDALSALLNETTRLPLWGWHREYIETCLACDGAPEHVTRELERNGLWSVDLYIGEWPGSSRHAITIRPR